MAITGGVSSTKKIADNIKKMTEGVQANQQNTNSGAMTSSLKGINAATKNTTAARNATNQMLQGVSNITGQSGGNSTGASNYTSNFNNLGVAPKFQQSQAVTDAMNYTNSLLQQLSSGKTSYSDQMDGVLKELMSRDKFTYDMETDPMWQQALAGAMASGKTAMQDTIGQASALTGGYGNTYGVTAGNNAYNQYVQGIYGELPEYYNLALEAYDMENQKLLNQLDALNAADTKEYERLYNAYAANSQAAADAYSKEYSEWADAFNNVMSLSSLNARNTSSGNNDGVMEYKKPSESQYQKALEAYNTGGEEALRQYIQTLPDDIDTDELASYVSQYGYYEIPMEQRTYTKTKDTKNWFWGIDNNDIVTDDYGNEYRLDELSKILPEDMIAKLVELEESKNYKK